MCTLPALAQSTVSVTTGDYWDAVLSDDGQAIQLIYSGSRRVKSVKLKQVHPFTIGVDASNQPVKALFSPGNLQYTPNPNKGDGKYRFAQRQWQTAFNVNADATLDMGVGHEKWLKKQDPPQWIDLFGWGMWLDDGTSGIDPMKTSSVSDKDYLPKFKSGILNTITAMGEDWRLPTSDEFDVVLGSKGVRDGKCFIANVKGVNGLVVLPDDWNIEFDANDWDTMEKAGAVFLPGAGSREDTEEMAVKYSPLDFFEWVRQIFRDKTSVYAGLYIATISGTQGWMWFPDWWDDDELLYDPSIIYDRSGEYMYCTVPVDVWNKLFQKGAEFTPLSQLQAHYDDNNSYRYVDYYNGAKGSYWTSKATDQSSADYMSFDCLTEQVSVVNSPRGIGRSVRMIRVLDNDKKIVVPDNASAGGGKLSQDPVTKAWSFTYDANSYYELQVEYDEVSVGVSPSSMMYTGGELKPDVTVSVGGVEVPASEYTLKFPDDIINVGSKTIDIPDLSNNAGGYIADCNAKYDITKRNLTITVDAKTKIYGDPDPEFTYRVQGLMEGDQMTGSLTRAQGENVGTYPIRQGTLTVGDNYNVIFKSANLTIKPFEAVTLVWGETNFVYNGSKQVPTATLSGMKDGDQCTVTVSGAQTNAGTYTATASALSNPNYAMPADNKTQFTIAKANPVITPPEPVPGLVFNNKPHELITPGSTTGGTLMYNIFELEYAPSLPKAVNVGDYIVHYYVEGDNNYNSSEVGSVTAYIAQSEIPVADDERIICDAADFCNGKATLSYLIVFGDVRSYTLKFEDGEIPQQKGAISEPEGDFEFSLPTSLRPGKYKGVVIFTDNLGKDSEEYPFEFAINRIFGVIKQLYYNTLCADNSQQLFSSYQWSNGGDIAGENNQYLHLTTGLKGSYTVWADMAGYGRYESCPFEPAKAVSSKKTSAVNVYPNPAKAHQQLTVRIENFDIEGNYEIHIFNDMGGIVATISDAQEYNQLSLSSGNYTGVLLVNGVKTGFKIIVK